MIRWGFDLVSSGTLRSSLQSAGPSDYTLSARLYSEWMGTVKKDSVAALREARVFQRSLKKQGL